MEKIKIPTSFNIELDFETPEFHKRLFAWLIDIAILVAYYVITMNVLQRFSSTHKAEGEDLPFLYNMSALYLLLFLPLLLYHLFFEVVMNGQSIGKKLIGIKVIGENGGRPALHQYLIRWLTRPFDFFFFGLVGLLTVVLSKKNQRLGDMAAGTALITLRNKVTIDSTILEEIDVSYIPIYPSVIKLSDNDVRIIKETLLTAIKARDYVMMGKLRDKIETVAGIKNQSGNDHDFIRTVLKDYNFYTQRM